MSALSNSRRECQTTFPLPPRLACLRALQLEAGTKLFPNACPLLWMSWMTDRGLGRGWHCSWILHNLIHSLLSHSFQAPSLKEAKGPSSLFLTF